MTTNVKAYWWDKRANFGDAIAPLLLAHFSDVDVTHTPPAEAEVVVVGSILHHLPASWEGTVLGAGTLYPDSKVPFGADFKAVRGPLTAALTGGDPAIGDPGLLAGELVGFQEKKYDVGVVPHWSDKDMGHKNWGKGAVLIDVTQDPLTVIRQIASCRRIVASSLHGIILADSFGVPRWTEIAPRMVSEGGYHKFQDHCAAVGVPFLAGEWQRPVFSRIEDRQHELYDAFKDFGNLLRRESWAAATE